jgi:hypothetical protein
MKSRASEAVITTAPQPYAIDKNSDGNATNDPGESVVPAGNLLRKVFTTTITIKNRL